MEKKRFYKSTVGLALLSCMAWLPATAQNDTLQPGSYENPLLSQFNIEKQGVYLIFHPKQGDLVEWRTGGSVLGTDTLLKVRFDVDLELKVRRGGVWSYVPYRFRGITTLSGDTLLAPVISGATYQWVKDGAATDETSAFYPNPTQSNYHVVITTETDTFHYGYRQEHIDSTGQGGIENAVFDYKILAGIGNVFTITTDADTVLWDVEYGQIERVNGVYVAKSNSKATVYVRKGNNWKKGILEYATVFRVSNSLRSNSFPEEAQLTWYRNGVLVPTPDKHSIPLLSPDSAIYKLNVKWNNDPTGSKEGNFYYQLTRNEFADISNAFEVSDLIVRTGNNYSKSSAYAADDILWQYYTLDPFTEVSSTDTAIFGIKKDAVIRLSVRRGNVWYTQKAWFGYQTDSVDVQEGTINNPIYDGALVVQQGNVLSFANHIQPDSLFWTLSYADTSSVSYTTPNVTLLGDAEVHVLVRSNGKWYAQSLFAKVEKSGSSRFDPIKNVQFLVRNGNEISIRSDLSKDTLFWNVYYNDGTKPTIWTPTVVLTQDAKINALLKSNGKWYEQTIDVKINQDTNSINNPIHDSTLIVLNGNELRIRKDLPLDAVIGTVKYNDGTVEEFLQPRIVLNKDAKVSVLVHSEGKWYEQSIDFKGINYDTTKGTLTAPLIENAQYEWYYNDTLLTETGASFVPNKVGTYKVVVTWVVSFAANGTAYRLESAEVNSATYIFKVEKLPVVAGLEHQSLASLVSLYPNPAHSSFVVNSPSAFNYHIEDMNANQVQRGAGFSGSVIQLEALEPGVYFVHIQTAQGQTVKRLVVE